MNLFDRFQTGERISCACQENWKRIYPNPPGYTPRVFRCVVYRKIEGFCFPFFQTLKLECGCGCLPYGIRRVLSSLLLSSRNTDPMELQVPLKGAHDLVRAIVPAATYKLLVISFILVVSSGLLEKENLITCSSHKNPHGESFSSRSGRKTQADTKTCTGQEPDPGHPM